MPRRNAVDAQRVAPAGTATDLYDFRIGCFPGDVGGKRRAFSRRRRRSRSPGGDATVPQSIPPEDYAQLKKDTPNVKIVNGGKMRTFGT